MQNSVPIGSAKSATNYSSLKELQVNLVDQDIYTHKKNE